MSIVARADVAAAVREERGGEAAGWEDSEEEVGAAGVGSSPKISSKAMTTDTKIDDNYTHCIFLSEITGTYRPVPMPSRMHRQAGLVRGVVVKILKTRTQVQRVQQKYIHTVTLSSCSKYHVSRILIYKKSIV